nr:hypothetical protein [Xanthomonadales bacterium]
MRVHRFSVLAALALAASAPQAAVLTVGPGSDCNTSSLATAITLADGLSGPDEIRIASTAVLTAQHLAISNQSLALSGGWSDCAANAIQVGRSTIVGDGRASVLSVRETTGSSYTLSLDRINLSGGGGGDDGVGGGIDLYGRWSVTVRRMEIHDNSTEFDGGGLMIEGPGTLSPASIDIGEDVDIRGNTARNGLGGGIAGKRALIKLRADRVVIRNNSAYRGGGIGADSSNVYVGAYGDETPYTTATGPIFEQNRDNASGAIALLGSG